MVIEVYLIIVDFYFIVFVDQEKVDKNVIKIYKLLNLEDSI